MFDFNDSLNDVAPASPMPFTVDMNKNGNNELMNVFCVSYFLLSSPLR